MTLVDDHTRFTWTYLIKHKHKFPSLFKQFVLIEKLSPLGVTMPKNSLRVMLSFSTNNMGSSFKLVVEILSNKMGLWNENIVIF